ncbi:MBL fold metallo-hydrolase [Sediminispirochaeta smaragdinae]|uniref:Metallo-beta-lactamase family protein n=1 Tax=Sediminispirochaeta smaragdinae (strain DSM 11293 / JCM 15392 / SEBR 4228) TaxID=573413 RepID=E1R319_SEDSS|nr:MBL fold metallo-hydrolase [Sediminispirochaeta smaragdinae]ADK81205.1 metallo-beta-lactamase family protein [Sediminispirochaeta smaragdinae DSM 11293]
MKIRFWGVRGSLPRPLTSEQVRTKIAAVLQMARPEDLDSQLSRERFLGRLPASLFGTVGGNTTCVEVRTSGNDVILFDAGSGMQQFSSMLMKEQEHIDTFHIFFSHFHWDHLQGLPFFSKLYDRRAVLHFYSPREDLREIIEGQMRDPYFPIGLDAAAAELHFHTIDNTPLRIGDASVRWKKMRHPGESVSYRVEERGKKAIFSTDTELSEADFQKTDANRAYFEKADLVIMDSQYTLGEAIEKYNWGHSSYSIAVDFASAWKIRHLVLFHHEPEYDDRKLYAMQQSADWYRSHLKNKKIKIDLATEDLVVEV